MLVLQSSLKEEALRNQQISQMVASLPQLPLPGEQISSQVTAGVIGSAQADGIKSSMSRGNLAANGPVGQGAAQPVQQAEERKQTGTLGTMRRELPRVIQKFNFALLQMPK